MAQTQRRNPLLGYNFEISLMESPGSALGAITGVVLSAVLERPAGGFSECTGLQMSLDVEEYEEGGNNGTVLKFPTRVKHNAITLRRGVGASTELWDWFYSFMEGRGTRRDGVITLRDEAHLPHTVWGFRRGLPTRWEGPTMNAGNSQVAIESIEITHEGLYLMPGASSQDGPFGG